MLTPWRIHALLRRAPEEEFASSANLMRDQGETLLSKIEHDLFQARHSVTDGIERIHYRPTRRSEQPPLLLQHGMWHSATCWERWQISLAKCGVETMAYSLPGHGRSPVQRPVKECSLAYYLRFLVDEMSRLNRPPVLVGHSMGGALVQWYLRYVGEPKAAAFIASWTARDILKDSLSSAMKIDLPGTFLSPFLGSKFQFRNDRVVQKWFLSEHAGDAARTLRPELGPESEIVLMQHRPPHWSPPVGSRCQKLWIAAESDAIIPLEKSKVAAQEYSAEFATVQGGHDLMLDVDAEKSAALLLGWLRGLPE